MTTFTRNIDPDAFDDAPSGEPMRARRTRDRRMPDATRTRAARNRRLEQLDGMRALKRAAQ